MRATLQTQANTPPRTPPAFTPVRSGLLQRKCACGGTPGFDGECEACRNKGLQRKKKNAGVEAQNGSEVLPIVHQVLPPPGQPFDAHTSAFTEPPVGHTLSQVSPCDPTGMPGRLRAKMESALAADFSEVRIRKASKRALELRARAFTQGNEIHMAPGHWAPETAQGQELLGHELGHVLQQRSGRVTATAQFVAMGLNDDPALEREAAALGARVAHAEDGHANVASQARSLPLAARLSGAAHQNSKGPIQRTPFGPPGGIHDLLLDEFSRDTGTPRDRASAHDAAYTSWLSVRRLDRLTIEELLATLTSLEASGQLNTLISNSSVVSSPRYERVMTAMQVVRRSRGAGANPQTALATVATSGLPAAEQLAMTHYVRVPTTHGADQRAAIAPGGAAAIPDADLTREIGYELDPSSRPAPVLPPVPVGPPGAPKPAPPPPPARIPWDGTTGSPTEAAARATMQAELFQAYDAYLNNKLAETQARLIQPRVAFTAPAAPAGAAPPPTGVVDIANQARAVLETRYGTSMDATATTPAQLSDRAVRQASGPGQNIFDASSEADRSTMTNSPDLAPGVAWWLFQNDVPGAAGAAGTRRFATEILAAHHYSTQDAGATQFRWQVANAYAAASTLAPNNRRRLIDYRMTGWSERGESGITLQSSFDPGANRNRAELVQRWTIFQTATHESLHLREHPAFRTARQGRGTLQEGFVEMFTIATLNTDVLPRARAGSVEPLRRTVEGALSPANPDATIITNRVTPTQYVEHRAQAERIRDGGTPAGGAPHTGIGEAAVRAAFFQGHVEYLGLAPAGSQLAGLPAAGAAWPTRIPGGIAGLDDLARRTGVPRSTIERDNPGITDALPPTAMLAGCREHWVVAGETRANIAMQNGVAEAELVRANPDIPLDAATSAWSGLTVGQKILIPVH